MSKRKRPDDATQIQFHKTIPALAAYITRIGAKEINFRSYVVQSEVGKGYFRDVVSVRVEMDNTISVRDVSNSLTKAQLEGYAPTKTEENEIQVALKDFKMPASIRAQKGSLPKQLEGIDPKQIAIFSDCDESIILIQQLIVTKTGEKIYLPWTHFSDGVWRNMEPDGGLPIWGLERLSKPRVMGVMIHEGVKAARRAQEIVDNKETNHPWYEELCKYTHIAWIGGAPNPHRTDWKPILALGASYRVVIACDNDRVGIEAIQYISKKLGRKLKYIRYDGKGFPQGFDMADDDDIPKDVKPLNDYIKPATWMTEPVYSKSKGPPTYKIRSAVTEEWWSVVTPAVYIHRDNIAKILTADEFNKLVAPFSDIVDAARLISKSNFAQCVSATYLPGEPPGTVTVDGELKINTCTPSKIKAIKGSPKPFLKFMRHLIPDKNDRKDLLQWIATLIARPDIKMLYAVLLISEQQGVGKGTLGEILAKILGELNVSHPSDTEIVDSNFNYWSAHKRLAVVHEIYAGKSWKAYNKLKSIITDPTIHVSKKHHANYEIPNWLHIFACSNSKNALRMSDEDRRWHVPKVTEDKRPLEYWVWFNDWLDGGGLGIIVWWAHEFIKKHGAVRSGVEAPMTSLKMEMIADSRSEEDQIAFDLASHYVERKEKIVIAVSDVIDFIESKLGNRVKYNKPKVAIKAMCRAGMKIPAKRGSEQQRFLIEPKSRTYSYIVANFEIGPDETWERLKEFYASVV